MTNYICLYFILDLICRFHKNSDGGTIMEKIFYQSLSSCLTNAKDWDGYRKLRAEPIQKELCSLFKFLLIFLINFMFF